jgi:hypothetical protein
MKPGSSLTAQSNTFVFVHDAEWRCKPSGQQPEFILAAPALLTEI